MGAVSVVKKSGKEGQGSCIKIQVRRGGGEGSCIGGKKILGSLY